MEHEHVVTVMLSLKPPQTQMNGLEKTSRSLCTLRCLFPELKTCKIIFFLFFIGNFDDSDLYDDSLPKGGGDGSGSNGKTVGCASY